MLAAPAPALVDQVESTLLLSVGKDYPWPGNVREVEQAVRRILLTGSYRGQTLGSSPNSKQRFIAQIEAETLDADSLLAGYCNLIYQSSGSYEAVARRTKLDRRTVKKHITRSENY
jgi:transcriptional regulator with GAF, ATPase, and Fis domain